MTLFAILTGCGNSQTTAVAVAPKIKPMPDDLRNCRGRPVYVSLTQATGLQAAKYFKQNAATVVRLDSCVVRLMCRDYFIRREIAKAPAEQDMDKACADPTKYPPDVVEVAAQ